MIPSKSRVNGLDLAALGETVEAIQQDAELAKVSFDVTTRWTGQTGSETTVDGYTLGGERIARSHKIVADEPHELLGADAAPNPQELLMAAVNACMTVGYVAGAAINGITLTKLEIRTKRHARPSRLPRPQRQCAAGLRSDRLRGADRRQRDSRTVRGNPPERHEDVTQLLQFEPSHSDERRPPGRLTRFPGAHPPPSPHVRPGYQQENSNVADLGIQKPNPNKALWEKGDFTRIAETMRESGEELVETLGIARGMKVLDLGCGDGTTALPGGAARR